MMAEEEPMMEAEQAPSSLAAEREVPVFGEEVMVEATAEEPYGEVPEETSAVEGRGGGGRGGGGTSSRGAGGDGQVTNHGGRSHAGRRPRRLRAQGLARGHEGVPAVGGGRQRGGRLASVADARPRQDRRRGQGGGPEVAEDRGRGRRGEGADVPRADVDVRTMAATRRTSRWRSST